MKNMKNNIISITEMDFSRERIKSQESIKDAQ